MALDRHFGLFRGSVAPPKKDTKTHSLPLLATFVFLRWAVVPQWHISQFLLEGLSWPSHPLIKTRSWPSLATSLDSCLLLSDTWPIPVKKSQPPLHDSWQVLFEGHSWPSLRPRAGPCLPLWSFLDSCFLLSDTWQIPLKGSQMTLRAPQLALSCHCFELLLLGLACMLNGQQKQFYMPDHIFY